MPAARIYGELGSYNQLIKKRSYNHTVSMRHISTDLLGVETGIFIPCFRLSKSLECITV